MDSSHFGCGFLLSIRFHPRSNSNFTLQSDGSFSSPTSIRFRLKPFSARPNLFVRLHSIGSILFTVVFPLAHREQRHSSANHNIVSVFHIYFMYFLIWLLVLRCSLARPPTHANCGFHQCHFYCVLIFPAIRGSSAANLCYQLCFSCFAVHLVRLVRISLARRATVNGHVA